MTKGMKSLTLDSDEVIVVFDAECVLCSANAQFILNHDHRKRIVLASMQGKYGSALYRKHGIDPSNPETLIVVKSGRLCRNSDAIFSIYSALGWPWRTALILKIIPRFLRDPVYLLIARNRYRWFGKRESCWLPSTEYADRVI